MEGVCVCVNRHEIFIFRESSVGLTQNIPAYRLAPKSGSDHLAEDSRLLGKVTMEFEQYRFDVLFYFPFC